VPGGSNPATMRGAIPGQTLSPAVVAGAVANAVAAGNLPPVQLQLVASNPRQSVGNTFQEKVMLTGGTDVYSVPLQVHYDQTKLQLINVDMGDLLGRDGQAVALVHRDDGAGNVVISTSRPPGVAGITGAGSVCTMTFQAKAAGDASIAITRPVIRNSKQQSVPVTGSEGVVHIQ
jgi:general secretion pathway protein D